MAGAGGGGALLSSCSDGAAGQTQQRTVSFSVGGRVGDIGGLGEPVQIGANVSFDGFYFGRLDIGFKKKIGCGNWWLCG